MDQRGCNIRRSRWVGEHSHSLPFFHLSAAIAIPKLNNECLINILQIIRASPSMVLHWISPNWHVTTVDCIRAKQSTPKAHPPSTLQLLSNVSSYLSSYFRRITVSPLSWWMRERHTSEFSIMNSDLYPPRFTLTEFQHEMNFIMTSNELLFSLILSSHKLLHSPLHTINVTSNATNTLNGCQRCFRGYIFQRREQQMVQLSSPFLKMLWWIRETRRSSRALLMVSRCEMLHILCTLSSYFTLPPRPIASLLPQPLPPHLDSFGQTTSVVFECCTAAAAGSLHFARKKHTLKLIPSVSYQQQKWKARNVEREFEVKTNLFIQNIYMKALHLLMLVARAKKTIFDGCERLKEFMKMLTTFSNVKLYFWMLNFSSFSSVYFCCCCC